MAGIRSASAAKALKELAFTFVLSFVNLAGAFLALSYLGGLEPWTKSQFVGLFGVLEVSMGLAFVFAPNIWRLPVAAANTSARTEIRLASSTLLIPHWVALAKVVGGLLMLAYAGHTEGVSVATLGLPLVILLLAVAFLALAAAVARFGVERPDLDVFFIIIRRPKHKDIELPGITATGMLVQFISTISVFPAKGVSPSTLYQPEFGPSLALLLWLSLVTAGFLLLGLAVWRGLISWRAPRQQEREAEKELGLAPTGVRR